MHSCPVCDHPLGESVHCTQCYGARCPTCAEIIYKDEDVHYPPQGGKRHFRCHAQPMPRPAFMLSAGALR